MKKLSLFAIAFFWLTGFAQAQAYAGAPGAFITIWTTDDGKIDFPGAPFLTNPSLPDYQLEVWDANTGTYVVSSTTVTGTQPVYTISGLTPGHIYEIITTGLTAFQYTNNFSGGAPSIYNSTIPPKTGSGTLIRLYQWGNTPWKMLSGAFAFASTMTVTAPDKPLLDTITSLVGMFSLDSAITTIPGIETWDVSNIKYMDGMFSSIPQFNDPITNWNVSNVTSTASMFWGCKSFNIPLSNWNISPSSTSNLTMTSAMFYGDTSFNQPLNNWNVSKDTNMAGMFGECRNFNQPLNNWITSSARTMQGMFAFDSLFNQPLNNWAANTGLVRDMSLMFYYCRSLQDPNIGSWNTSSVTNMSYMFAGSANFYSSTHLNWNTSNVTDMSAMFANTAFNQPLDDPAYWDVSSVKNMSQMFYVATKFNSSLNGWGAKTHNVKNMSGMFNGATAFNQPLDGWDVSSDTSMQEMFSSALAFDQPLADWKTGNVVDMGAMFDVAQSYNQMLANWDLHSITNLQVEYFGMTHMLDFSGLDCTTYSETLIGWANNLNLPGAVGQKTTPTGINLGAQGLHYSRSGIGAEAHDSLTSPSIGNWIINDAGPSCTPLPITLLSFTAQAQANNTALLQWATATETNNKGFYVERSPNGANWTDLTFVNSQATDGNSSVQLNYQYTDNNPLAGENYYRLKQVDLNGTVAYSEVQELNFNKQLQVSPNPASGEVRVTLPTGASNVPYKLIGTDGKVILSGTMNNIGGYGRISVSNISAGMYFLQIIINNTKQTCKLQVVH
jgi:surface protein